MPTLPPELAAFFTNRKSFGYPLDAQLAQARFDIESVPQQELALIDLLRRILEREGL